MDNENKEIRNAKNIISTIYTADAKEKMRSQAEINARYQVCCKRYKEFKNCSAEFREQKVMSYAELKVLGWVLGKSDTKISQEANF